MSNMPSTQPAAVSKIFAAQSRMSDPLLGRVLAPGDKSMSHRAIIFGALAQGVTTVTGLLEGADIMSTAQTMRDLGAKVERHDDGSWHVTGVGPKGLSAPSKPVDCGNAGTGVRLIMGAAAAYPIAVTYTGDASLTSRPMGRVVNPLRDMGVRADGAKGDRLPMTVTGPEQLLPLRYAPPQASAQVKSAILLAGLGAKGVTEVTEAHITRDHTENMLRAFGCPVESLKTRNGQTVRISGPAPLTATHVNVPGDPSSAAFLIVAALIVPGSDIVIENVMMNPARTGLFETLTEMGGHIRADNFRKSGGEVIADIEVKYSKLHGVRVPELRAPAMIDEYPVLCIAAAFASGETVMDGIEELRVKESDRIAATLAILHSAGVQASDTCSSLRVTGSPVGQAANKAGQAVRSGGVAGGGYVKTYHDHRIAMSALVLGLATHKPMSIDDADMIATSFPEFFDLMRGLGADIEMKP